MQIVRALVVTEDSPNINTGGFGEWKTQGDAAARHSNTAYSFHLGEFIRVLKATTWVGFQLEVVCAHRNSSDYNGVMSQAQFQADRHADVIGFRFDQTHVFNGQTRAIGDYDMILFFPQVSQDPLPNDAATKGEADAIATFMEAGHGMFATGDHYNLRGPSEQVAREQFLGVAGLAPQMDAMLKLGMGAAVITAATLVHERELDLARIESRFDQVFAHGVGLYGKQLRAGREVYAKLEKLVAR